MDIAVTLTATGGIDQLQVLERAPQSPGPTEIRVRHEAIGVNFLDIYHRKGVYPLPSYPAVLGAEGAGTVEAIGSEVTLLVPGDRIAYAGAPVGAYSSTRLLPAERAIKLPEGIGPRTAAASTLKGMTAYMLVSRTYVVSPGTVILVHAAAGGLGAILVRWAKYLGATVIGTVSSEEKAALARSHGADHLIVGRDADLVRQVLELTGGRGVDVGYDGIGGDMLAKTIKCIRPFGIAASFGQAAGPIPPVSLDQLRPNRALAHPSIMAATADQAFYAEAAAALIDAFRLNITAVVGEEFALADAARAHTELEAGRTTGSLLLIP
ncbi:quinone oxidoreductase [Mesorhizobium sp. YC-39]|uniref:quinone oxidoreductase family protein n=1 Tax=unclassified Mesorhizobium TaxID=325217 RepID=UPI0021E7CFEB|nr:MULTISPECIES: quinone oxidoreductase [unclassified Mesorhizobium]MCV3208618.1 quinone oxidoreductase [Mesorhizobium sp. YC-2]MCV3232033.1 quinone oxidoreductase [Mesorhizobium sp. YC-39]